MTLDKKEKSTWKKLIAHWKEILLCNTYPVEIREIANSVMITLKIDYYNDQSRLIAFHATLVIFLKFKEERNSK